MTTADTHRLRDAFSDDFFNRIDEKIAAAERTLDQYLRDFEATRMPIASRVPPQSGWLGARVTPSQDYKEQCS